MKKIVFYIFAILILLVSYTFPVNANTDDNVIEQYSGGGFLDTVLEDETPDPAPPPPDDGIPSCSRTFYHEVSTVPMQVANAGGDYRSLMWGFNLTTATASLLGPTVTVSMPAATINGRTINPPYAPHTEPATYNFHGSLKNYQYIGGSYTLKKYDVVYFNWLVKSVKDPTKGAYRYVKCRVF
jgi:hypothetical protein